MNLVCRLSLAGAVSICLSVALAADNSAKQLPDGPGKDAVAKVCSECHSMDNVRKRRQSRDQWSETIADMVDRGAEATEDEISAVLDYLSRNFGPDSKIWVNTAPFVELKSVVKLNNDEAKAVIDFRNQKGNFVQWSDLLKVPGVDAKKIEAAKELMAF